MSSTQLHAFAMSLGDLSDVGRELAESFDGNWVYEGLATVEQTARLFDHVALLLDVEPDELGYDGPALSKYF